MFSCSLCMKVNDSARSASLSTDFEMFLWFSRLDKASAINNGHIFINLNMFYSIMSWWYQEILERISLLTDDFFFSDAVTSF